MHRDVQEKTKEELACMAWRMWTIWYIHFPKRTEGKQHFAQFLSMFSCSRSEEETLNLGELVHGSASTVQYLHDERQPKFLTYQKFI